MDNAIIDRTPQIIATEINSIKDQTGKMLLYSAIEIGRRLTEAKSLVNHGEWGKWLDGSVNYSQSTAERLMRLFEEYGDKLLASDSSSNSAALQNLSYTQAVILLGIPEDEREKFITENDIAGMSTRELQQAIKERDQAISDNAGLQKTLGERDETIVLVTAERDALKNQAASYQEAARINESTVKSLQQQINTAKKDGASAERITTLEKDLKAARTIVSANRVAFQFANVTRGFEELLEELTRLGGADPEAHEKYKGAIREFIGKITGRLL